LSKKRVLPDHKEMRQKFYSSGIGPDTDEEATAIHKGVYDAISIWRPDKFIKQLLKAREQGFEEFEDRERHYYYSVFVTLYLMKFTGVLIALETFPAVASYL